MSQIKKIRLYYMISLITLIVFPSTFLVMPLSNIISSNYTRGLLVIVGAIFWTSCITGYTLLFLAYRLDKKISKKKKYKRKYLFANPITIIADICLIAGVILFAVLTLKNSLDTYAVYIDLFIIILAFNMHLLFGRNLNKRIKVRAKNCKEES